MLYVCHSLSFAQYQVKPQIVSLCLCYGRYGSNNNTKGNVKYIVLPLSLRTIAYIIEYAPFKLWLSFRVGLFVNIIWTVKCNEFIRLRKIFDNIVAVTIS